MNLFNWNGAGYVLHSGDFTRFLVDCDALTDADLDALALIAWPFVGPFTHVIGIPRGGLRFARAMQRHVMPCGADLTRCPARVLLVDDVLTTGTSFLEMRAIVDPGVPIIGLCIFRRGSVSPPDWVRWLFSLEVPA